MEIFTKMRTTFWCPSFPINLLYSFSLSANRGPAFHSWTVRAVTLEGQYLPQMYILCKMEGFYRWPLDRRFLYVQQQLAWTELWMDGIQQRAGWYARYTAMNDIHVDKFNYAEPIFLNWKDRAIKFYYEEGLDRFYNLVRSSLQLDWSLHSLKSSWLFCLWSSFCANLLMKMVRIHGYSSLMYLLHIYEGMECLVCDFNHLLDWLHLPFHVRQQQGLLLTKDVSHHDGPLITSGWFYFLIIIPPLIASIYTFLTGIQTTVDLIRILRLCIPPPT